jgi:hypothetical protein
MRVLGTALLAALGGSAAFAQFVEVEPNDTKATANDAGVISPGPAITGTTTGSSLTVPGIGSADNFLVTVVGAPLGIYRHRLIITTTGTAGHSGSIRGLSQSAGVPTLGTDVAVQASSTATTPPRFNQWYGFGKGEQFVYRVTGVAATTEPYLVTMETEPVTPFDLGIFLPGSIHFTTRGQGHTTDTDFWIYDAGLNAIPGFGNDDTTLATGVQGDLIRTFAPGRYYIALTNYNLANDQGSPPDDRWRHGIVTDFPDIVVNSSSVTGHNLAMSVTHPGGTVSWANTKAGPYDINWATFYVVPEPGTMLALGAGIAALALRRRRRK